MAEAFTADVVFVGSGIAAAVAGAKLAQSGINVLFLEAGPETNHAIATTNFQKSVSKAQDSPYPMQPYAPQPVEADFGAYYVQMGPETFRGQQARLVGGTTWHWGGLAARFKPNDFRLATEYGVGVDWPIGYDDLAPWYDLAESEIGVAGDNSVDWGSPRSSGYPMPVVPMSWSDQVVGKAAATLGLTMAPFPQGRNSIWRDGRPQCCGNASCVPICPIQAKYDATVHLGKAIKAGARVVSQAVVNRVVASSDGTITGLTFLRPDKTEGTVTAKIFVIAAHTIETAKLLLMSTSDATPNGVANSSDQVGRNLLSQIDVGIQGLSQEPVYNYRGPVSTGGIVEYRDGDFRKDHAAFGISPSNEGWQRATGPFTAAAALIKQGLSGEALKAALYDQVSRQILIGTSAEMLPDDYNRVRLSDQTDALGIPRPAIWFRTQEYVTRAHAVARDVQNKLMAALNATEITQLGPVADSAIMGGTTRMGADPKTSVVDANLRAHDHPNLFIVGSQVFPSISANAPTLTVAALSARLGDYLATEMKG